MFKITKVRNVKNWPTVIKLPTDNGKIIEHPITVDLELISSSEFTQLSRAGDAELFKRVVTGWSDIADEDGQPFEYSDANKALAADNQFFFTAVLNAYMQASSGQAAQKN